MSYASAARHGAGQDFKNAAACLQGNRARIRKAKARAIEIVTRMEAGIRKTAAALEKAGALDDQAAQVLLSGGDVPPWWPMGCESDDPPPVGSFDLAIEMSKSEKPAAPTGEVRIISDRATGKVKSVVARLTDGSERTLYPLTAEHIEEFERELTAPRH